MQIGDERKIVLLKNIKSPYFDEAYFVMKRDYDGISKSDILLEAEKILCKSKLPKKKRGHIGKIIYSFCCGILSGASVAFLITLFI